VQLKFRCEEKIWESKLMSKSLIGAATLALLWIACAKQSTLRSVEKNLNSKFQRVDLDFKSTQTQIENWQTQDAAFSQALADKLGSMSEESARRFGGIYDSLKAQSEAQAQQLELLRKIAKRPGQVMHVRDTSASESVYIQVLNQIRMIRAQMPALQGVNVYPSTLIVFDSLHAGEFTLIRPQGREAQEALVLQYIPILLDSSKASAQGNATASYELRLELLKPRDTKDFIDWQPAANAGAKSWWSVISDFFQKLFSGNAEPEASLPNESLPLLSEVFSVAHGKEWSRDFTYLDANEKFECSFLLRINSKTANPQFKPNLRVYHHQLEYVNWWRRNLGELLLALLASLVSFMLGLVWDKLPFKLPFQNRGRSR